MSDFDFCQALGTGGPRGSFGGRSSIGSDAGTSGQGQMGGGQGLTHVHFIAQPKPFWSHLTVSPCLIDWGKIMHPTYPTKCAYVEPKIGRAQALGSGATTAAPVGRTSMVSLTSMRSGRRALSPPVGCGWCKSKRVSNQGLTLVHCLA